MGNAETKDHPIVKSHVSNNEISFVATPLQLETTQSFVDVLVEHGIKVLTPVVVSSSETFLGDLDYETWRFNNDACFVFGIRQDYDSFNVVKVEDLCHTLFVPRKKISIVETFNTNDPEYFAIVLHNTFPIYHHKRIKHLEELVEHQQGQIVELSNKLNEAIEKITEMWYHELMPGGQLQLKKAKEGFFENE